MNDPHVVALIYHIEHDNSVSYEQTKPLVHGETEFRVKVKNKKVRFKLNTHYPTESEARKREGIGNDLTEQERRFLEEAVKKMIYRAAERINDPTKNLNKITLNDLPPV